MSARGKVRALIAGMLLLTAAVTGVLTARLNSPLGGDTRAYLPPAVRWAAGQGLTNPYYERAVRGDPSGEARLIYHGFLYQRLVGALMSEPTYAAAARVLGYFGMASILLGVGWVLWPKVAKEGSSPWVEAVLVIGAAQALAGEVLLNGRPEGVGTFWVVLGLAALLKLRAPWNYGLAGAALGLLGATSPIGAVLAGLALLAWLARELPERSWLAPYAWVAGGCAGAFLAAVAFYPYTIKEWLTGLTHNADPVTGYMSYHWLSAWLFTSAGPLFGLILFVALVPVVADAVAQKRRKTPLSWGLYLFTLAIFVLAGFYFARDERNYNLRLLMPVWVILASVGAIRWARIGGWRRVGPWVVGGVLAAGGAEVWRQAALQSATPSGVSREAFADTLQQIETHGTVALTDGLLVATSPTDARISMTEVVNGGGQYTTASTADFLCLQQINPTRLTPPQIAGWEYVWDDFSDEAPRLFGLPLARRPQGFQVAVYRRMGSSAQARGLIFPTPAAHPARVK